MAKPTDVLAPEAFSHINLTLANNVETQPFPTSTPLRAGVWITLDNRDFRIAFTPGVLAPGGGLLLRRWAPNVHFFPCSDASLLRVASNGPNGRIAIMAA